MKYKKDKIFYKFKDKDKIYKLVTYDESKIDYYSLIKKYQREGYYQLIINSRLMIDLIKDFKKIDLTVYDIELQEDDETFYGELRKTLKGLKNKHNSELCFKYLLQSLNLLYCDNSIEINKRRKNKSFFKERITVDYSMKKLYKNLLKPLMIIIFSLSCAHFFNLTRIIPIIPKKNLSLDISIYSVFFTYLINLIEDYYYKSKISVELYLNTGRQFLNKKDENLSMNEKKPATIYAKIHCDDARKILNFNLEVILKVPDFVSASCGKSVVQENRDLHICKLDSEDMVIPISVMANEISGNKSDTIYLTIKENKNKRKLIIKTNKMKIGV